MILAQLLAKLDRVGFYSAISNTCCAVSLAQGISLAKEPGLVERLLI